MSNLELKVEKKVDPYRHSISRVIRDGETKGVDFARIVPGDIILLKAGEVVPCDDLPKSFLLTAEYGLARVYLTTYSTATLEKHMAQKSSL